MKLLKNKNNKEDIVFALKYITKMRNYCDKLYTGLNPVQYSENQGWWFVDYYNVQDIISYLFVGRDSRSVYEMFGTCRDQENKPVGWYTTQYSLPGDGSIPSGDDYSGYIPDCIEDVILNKEMKAKKKYKILNRMYTDLCNQHNNFKPTKKRKKKDAQTKV